MRDTSLLSIISHPAEFAIVNLNPAQYLKFSTFYKNPLTTYPHRGIIYMIDST